MPCGLLVLGKSDPAHRRPVKFGTGFAVHLKPENFRRVVVNFGWAHDGRGVILEENVGKGGSEHTAIEVQTAGAASVGHVGLLAPGAVHLDAARAWLVIHSKREHALSIAVQSRAGSVHTLNEFVVDFGEACRGFDEAGVQPPVNFKCVLI